MTIYRKDSEILCVRYLGKQFDGMPVIENISFSLKENEFVSLLGPSGSGKSTLFNIISGLLHPDSGEVIIEGTPYTGKTGRVSYMQQNDLLLPWKKTIDNVALPLVIKGQSTKEAREAVMPYFKVFGLEGFEYKYPFQLSGGMRQRAALLRTYMFSRDIILLDEPFGALDAMTRAKMQMWLLEMLEQLQASVLFITHDIEEAVFLSDRIYILSNRPAVIQEEIQVGLPRPRTKDTVTSEKFIEIKKHILKLF